MTTTRLSRTLTLLALALLSHFLGSCPPAGAQTRPARDPDPEWWFEPLGPEGAELQEIVSLGNDRWIARTAGGELMLWDPATFGRGAWGRIALGLEGSALRLEAITTRVGESVPVALLSSGALVVWTARGASGAGSDRPGETGSVDSLALPGPAVLEDDTLMRSVIRSTARAGAFRLAGWLSPDVVRRVVAILPAAGSAGSGFVLLTRKGGCHLVYPDGTWESWQARFVESGPEGTSSAACGDREDCGLRMRAAFAHPSDPALFLAITEWEGLFASRDGAHSFTPASGGLPKVVRAVGSLAGGGLCATCPKGVFISRDRGATWNQTGSGLTAARGVHAEICRLIADPSGEEHLFAQTRRGRLLQSPDGGATWETLLRRIPVRVRALACDPEGSLIQLATSRGALCSRDGGVTWEWRNRGLRQVAVLSIDVADNGGGLLLGTDLGFYAGSQRGCDWLPRLRGSRSGGGGGGAWHASDASRAGAPVHPATCESEAAWACLSASVPAVAVSTNASGLRVLCAATDRGLVFRRCAGDLSDEGCGWQVHNPGRAVTAVLALVDGSLWASGGEGSGLWAARAGPTGEWTELLVPQSAANPLFPGGALPALCSSSQSARDSVLLTAGALVCLTTGGLEPVPLPPGREGLAAASTEDGMLWVGTDAGLYRRTAPREWTLSGFENQRVGLLLCASQHAGTLLCRTAGGIFWTTDGGEIWTEVPVPSGLQVISLGLDAGGQRIFLGTRCGLIAARPPQLASLQVGRPLPIHAFPNPFSSHVLLRCRLAPVPATGDAGGSQDPAGRQDLTAGLDGPAVPAESLAGEDPPHRQAVQSYAEQSPMDAASLAELEFRIISVHGQLVHRIKGAEAFPGEGGEQFLEWTWDGRNDRGQEAPNGIYLVSTRVGKQSYVGKIVKFR